MVKALNLQVPHAYSLFSFDGCRWQPGPRPEVLKFMHAPEPTGQLVKNTVCWSPHPAFLIP